MEFVALAPSLIRRSSRSRTSSISRVSIIPRRPLLRREVEHDAEPLFLSCAEIDHTFPNEFRNRAVDILEAEKKPFQVQLFHGVEHGFALRG